MRKLSTHMLAVRNPIIAAVNNGLSHKFFALPPARIDAVPITQSSWGQYEFRFADDLDLLTFYQLKTDQSIRFKIAINLNPGGRDYLKMGMIGRKVGPFCAEAVLFPDSDGSTLSCCTRYVCKSVRRKLAGFKQQPEGYEICCPF